MHIIAAPRMLMQHLVADRMQWDNGRPLSAA